MRAPSITIERARAARRQVTPPEVIVWQGLRDARQFRRPHPIGPYILDFYCPAVRLAVEIDGFGHSIAERVRHDERRTAWLTVQGIRVLRIAARDVLDTRERQCVFATILAAGRGL